MPRIGEHDLEYKYIITTIGVIVNVIVGVYFSQNISATLSITIIAIILSVSVDTVNSIKKFHLEVISNIKSKNFVEGIFGADKIYMKLEEIVDNAKDGDTIFVSAHMTPSDRESKKTYYYNIKKKAMDGVIVLNRLAYIAPFEKDKNDYVDASRN